MIRELLPETLEYLENVATKHHGAEYTMWSRSQVHGLTETQCFLSLLSAVLERNSPKDDSGLSYTASGSHSSRGNSTTSDSRASSTVMKSYRYRGHFNKMALYLLVISLTNVNSQVQPDQYFYS